MSLKIRDVSNRGASFCVDSEMEEQEDPDYWGAGSWPCNDVSTRENTDGHFFMIAFDNTSSLLMLLDTKEFP